MRVFSSRQAMVIGPVPPGIGVIQPATSATAAEVDVADDAGLRARHADVDDRGARLDVVGGDHAGLAGGADEDVGLATHRGEVGGARVGERDGGVDALAGEQQRQRQPDERRAADDDGPLARPSATP